MKPTADFADAYPHPVVEVDADGRLTFLNRAARRVFPDLETKQRPQALLRGITVVLQMLTEHQETVTREVTVGKNSYTQEITRVPGSARYRIYLSDITERKRLDQLKDEFISTVSHELRTPLTIIKGAIGNLKDGIVGELTPLQNKMVVTADRNVDRLTRIINDLLDLSRLESGHARLNRQAVLVAPLLRDVLHNFALVASEAGLTLAVEVADDALQAFADPDLFVQVVTNLVTNAIRFAATRVRLTAVGISYEAVRAAAHMSPLQLPPPFAGAAQRCVRVTVSDDGPGVPEAVRDQLFSKFAQIHRPVGGAGYKGTGLGLSICRAIVEQHGGAIWVQPADPQGACFCFTVPQYHEMSECWAAIEDQLRAAETRQQACAVVMLQEPPAVAAAPDREAALRQLESVLRERVVRQRDELFLLPTAGALCLVLSGGKAGVDHLLQRMQALDALSALPWRVTSLVYPDDAPGFDTFVGALHRTLGVPSGDHQ